MQTLEFTRALQEIVAKLRAREIIDFLSPYLVGPQNQPILPASKDNFSTLILESNTGFSLLASDPHVKKVLDALSISEVYAAPRMGKLLGAFSVAPSSQQIWGHMENFGQFYSFVDMLRWLTKLSNGCVSLLETERVASAPPGTQVIELEIVADDGKGVEAERVKRFFSSLIELHAELARFLKVENARLDVIYVDSGSILVGLGMTVVIAERLTKLLREIWQEVKFGPFESLNKKMDSLSKVLTITKEIDAQIQSNVLDGIAGKALKHRILAEATAIIEVGAMLPAENASEDKAQRKLLTERRVKLLGSGERSENDDGAEKP